MEDLASTPAPVVPELDEPQEALLMGLDAEHAAFARLLLTRSVWTRIELEEVAALRRLPLDGALEKINEAADSRYGALLLEGDDAVHVNQELAQEVLQ
jgi:hypothetical protein